MAQTKDERTENLRQMLEEKQKEVQKEIDGLIAQSRKEQTQLREESVPDPEDSAFQNSTEEKQISILEARNRVRMNIDTALQKLNDGTYGICEDCGEPINEARLKVQPFAKRCISCQEQAETIERIEKQPDREAY
jgi:DnaK suppressor protein